MSTAGRSSVVAGDVPRVIHPDATIEITFLSDIEQGILPSFHVDRSNHAGL
ncbi:hypothetical protein ABH992_003272 [Bradyrhizobium yuanmingense]|uniref:Uncharacterized protein n=1 Tax=Bradyrhizobium yuanmingense TaxID=108015 RepID=A0ABV4GIX4_9BRAD|nr:hypothetical protein [Bradyrhizobium liaoningense]